MQMALLAAWAGGIHSAHCDKHKSGHKKQPKDRVFRAGHLGHFWDIRDPRGGISLTLALGCPGQSLYARRLSLLFSTENDQDVPQFGSGRPGTQKTLYARKLWAAFSFPRKGSCSPTGRSKHLLKPPLLRTASENPSENPNLSQCPFQNLRTPFSEPCLTCVCVLSYDLGVHPN